MSFIRCWAQDPHKRLSAVEIVRKLKRIPYKFKHETPLTRQLFLLTHAFIHSFIHSFIHYIALLFIYFILFATGPRSRTEVRKPTSSSDIHQMQRPVSHPPPPPDRVIFAVDPEK